MAWLHTTFPSMFTKFPWQRPPPIIMFELSYGEAALTSTLPCGPELMVQKKDTPPPPHPPKGLGDGGSNNSKN